MYTNFEIVRIFENCQNIAEIYKACEIFAYLNEEIQERKWNMFTKIFGIDNSDAIYNSQFINESACMRIIYIENNNPLI